MHPETPHTVLTTKTCVAIGTHFYSFATTRETFFAMVAEHFNGRFITNVEHPRAPLLYLKAIDALYDTFCGIYGENCETLPSQWHSELFLHAFSNLADYIHQVPCLCVRRSSGRSSSSTTSQKFTQTCLRILSNLFGTSRGSSRQTTSMLTSAQASFGPGLTSEFPIPNQAGISSPTGLRSMHGAQSSTIKTRMRPRRFQRRCMSHSCALDRTTFMTSFLFCYSFCTANISFVLLIFLLYY